MMESRLLEDLSLKEINPPLNTQSNEAFSEATHADATSLLANIRSKVYPLPKLWYLRVNVIEARDLVPSDKIQLSKVHVTGILRNQTLKTRLSMNGSNNPAWNEDLMFVAEEPFNEPLILNVEHRVKPNIDELLGTCAIPLQSVDTRLDDKPVNTRWFDLEKHVIIEGEKFNGKIHVKICLEGGYHVLHELTQFSSDLRPTAKQLWPPSIGVLKLVILGAHNLSPMKLNGPARMGAYCVVKYGQKWVRTSTVLDSYSPKWNEQYTWEVFDPCTVVTIGVFTNNFHLRGGDNYIRDSIMGKVRVRLSNLETNRLYTYSYPLLLLQPSGVTTMGEIQLAFEFNCSAFSKTLHMYFQPLLPKMHYIHPLNPSQLDNLRYHASRIVSMRLSEVESPLKKEVVEYMLHADPNNWSLRKSKVNFFRIITCLNVLVDSVKHIRSWKNPTVTLVIHVLFSILVLYPRLILPATFLCFFLVGIWNFRWRPRHSPHIDSRLSHAHDVHPDELDEEFDAFPTARRPDIVRMRYDRLRSVFGRIVTVAGDLALLGERLQYLLSWRYPIATALTIICCLILTILTYVKPFEVVILSGFYLLRHPWLRSRHLSVPRNFFTRLGGTNEYVL